MDNLHGSYDPGMLNMRSSLAIADRCMSPWMDRTCRAVHRRPSRKDARFEVPVLMVIGEKDYAFKFPGFEAAVRGGAMERFAPELKIEFLPEGSHFAQEQLPEQVNRLLLGFFTEHPVAAD